MKSLVLIGMGAAVLLTAACQKSETVAAQPQGEPSATYTTRGIVRGFSSDRTSISIEHEAIDSFTDQGGSVVGMPAMTMPFAVASLAQKAGGQLSVGDKIAFTCAVYWGQDPNLYLTEFDKLPPETALKLTR